MVGRDDNAFTPRKKRCEKAWRQRQKARDKIRKKSRALVKAGVIERRPCVCCGSEENLTIHHLEPLAPGYFVWLCESCHRLAHTPIYRTIRVKVAPGQFSVLPQAAVRRRGEVLYL